LILLLRSGAEPLPQEALGEDVDVLVTHDIVPVPDGIRRAQAFDPTGARLIISSKTTVKVLVEAGADALFRAPFVEQLAAGEETARALERAGAHDGKVGSAPGAAGILDLLAESGYCERFLWPRGSDADEAPVEDLCAYGADVSAPVVYRKEPRPLDPGILERLRAREYTAVAVSSVATLDHFLASAGQHGVSLPAGLRWAAIGPGTARAFESRGLPVPDVPARPRLLDLINLLRES
jgi:uroporphyrinogen-III synthase